MASAGVVANTTTEKKESQVEEQVPESLKHPLQNKWYLWFLKPDKSKDWEANLSEVTSFNTVEDFWAVYNHIKPPSTMNHGSDYMLFKEGIKPMWEDKGNRAGGRWLLTLDKRDRSNVLDACWMETLMCLVGEGFGDSSDEVCGAVVQVRNRGDKMAIWTANGKKEDNIMQIGRLYKEKLLLHVRDVPLAYQLHDDVSTKTSSVSKRMYTV